MPGRTETTKALPGSYAPGAVICATDQVAADARASEFLGKSAKEIRHIVLAARQGLGEMEIDYRQAGYKETM